MSLTISITESQVLEKLRALLLGIVPSGTQVVQGLDNRVPPPIGAYVVMTPLFDQRLATNTDVTSDPYPLPGGSNAMGLHIRLNVQLDFYGPLAGDWAKMFTTVWRDDYACDALKPTCQPLHADEARRMPYVTGEDQYQSRWTVTAALQYNPVTTTTQQFAGAAEVTLIEVDEAYPPT
jgi:hypothetical protein